MPIEFERRDGREISRENHDDILHMTGAFHLKPGEDLKKVVITHAWKWLIDKYIITITPEKGDNVSIKDKGGK